jgi:predicted ester cyclase
VTFVPITVEQAAALEGANGNRGVDEGRRAVTFENIYFGYTGDGVLVATRWTCTSTHEGELMRISPTGIRVTQPGMDISHLSDGKVAETWEGYNPMVMMQQLGVMSEPQHSEEASPT